MEKQLINAVDKFGLETCSRDVPLAEHPLPVLRQERDRQVEGSLRLEPHGHIVLLPGLDVLQKTTGFF